MTPFRFLRGWIALTALLAIATPMAATQDEPADDADSAPSPGGLNPYGLPAEGFIGPTFEGPWRFRGALNVWAPTTVKLNVEADRRSNTRKEGLGWFLDAVDNYIPINGEVRKGPFGFFVHTFFFKVGGEKKVRGEIEGVVEKFKWNDRGFWIDTGLSYELGRWALGDGPRAPELTIEPFVAARLIRQRINADFTREGVLFDFEFDATSDEFSTYEPIIGLRTFWDLTEHWNLHLEGDYGGFGVDDNHQTWHALGLVGYRWPGWGAHWNLQVGYRQIRVFDLRPGGYEAKLDLGGPNIIFSVDF